MDEDNDIRKYLIDSLDRLKEKQRRHYNGLRHAGWCIRFLGIMNLTEWVEESGAYFSDTDFSHLIEGYEYANTHSFDEPIPKEWNNR